MYLLFEIFEIPSDSISRLLGPMPPPPAKKRRKTAAGSVAVTGTHWTTRSLRPGLIIEMIGKVATFAQYGDDLMNICIAVGPKESAFVRHACLRNNMGYLERTLEQFSAPSTIGGPVMIRCKEDISAWMAVNTDWRKLCTKERAEDDELSTPRYRNEEEEIVFKTEPLIIFNNPAAAIEFCAVDILKHLVEEVGIDINACKWNGLIAGTKWHLLVTALGVAEVAKNPSCFNYLISLSDINVSPTTTEASQRPLWCVAYANRCSCKSFRAMVEHPSFYANRPFEISGQVFTPLFYAFRRTIEDQDPKKRQKKVEKFQILLDVGADPELAIPSPLDNAKSFLRRVIARRDERFNVEEGEKLIYLMEEKVAG